MEKCDGDISVGVTKDDNVIFYLAVAETSLENNSWISR